MFELTFEDVEAARARIAGVVSMTPLVPANALPDCGGPVWLKCEHLQLPAGSFKVRGACNKLAGLYEEERARGLLTVSAGNHARAVAWCARLLGLDAVVFMPENAPRVKVEAAERFGARVVLRGADYDECARHAHAYERESGRTFVHPFCDPAVIAGQGTVALEILEQRPDTRTIIVPVGGGGLAVGCAVAAKGVNPAVRIIGVQPARSAPFYHAMRAGRDVRPPIHDSLADALTGELISSAFFNLFRRWVDEVVVVDEEAIAAGVYWLLAREQQVVEGGGAVGVSALLRGLCGASPGECAVVLTGNGIDAATLFEIAARYRDRA